MPNAGVTGWRVLPTEAGTAIVEPFVFCVPGGARAPAVVHAGGAWHLWYVTATGAIARATATDGIHDWTDEGSIAIPGSWSDVSVAGHDGEWRLAAGAADRSGISVFASTDAGIWTAAGSLPATAPWTGGDVGGPALLADGASGGWLLFHDGASRHAIGVARSLDGTTWDDDDAPLLTPASIRAATGWSVLAIGAPTAGLDTSRPGDPVYKLWFEAAELRHLATPSLDEVADVIGFAGSFDATSFVPWRGNPVFQQRVIAIPGSPAMFTPTREPSVVADTYSYRMFFESPFDLDGQPERPCIAVAVDP